MPSSLNFAKMRARPLFFSLLLTSLMLLGILEVFPLNITNAQTTSQLTVASQDINGTTITGFYSVLYLNRSVLSTGFTPVSFTMNDAQSYIIQMDDYGSCSFAYWQDTGNASATRTISISNNTQIVAAYNCGPMYGSRITVNSVDQNGNELFGYYAMLFDSTGNLLATGFTSKTFATTAGQAYNVEVDGYGSCTFSQWSDGVTNDPRSFNATTDVIPLTAVFDCASADDPAPPPSLVMGNITWTTQAYHDLEYIFPASVAINGKQYSATFYESLIAQVQLVPGEPYAGYYAGTFAAISGCQQGANITVTATVNGVTNSGSTLCPAAGNSTSINLNFATAGNSTT